ncbi:anaerobic sulfatase maturase [Persicobacter diffluens]|uniref:Anaerobic sulfatase maturase n=2 Tax=Persicobacter diffluens TaxID=981 RepID=A0AAN4VZA7_9BACT|nr:anaerobic sulfatase maturase [Persicobacter diffluens]
MPKPVGPVCNLDCSYCYYLEKDRIYPEKEGKLKSFTMSDEVLEHFIQQYIAAQPDQIPEVTFTWHGGEPTLAGLPYFEKIIALQKKYAKGKNIKNNIQTNGMFIDDDWAKFLHQHDWLVGLSIDGPQDLHDPLRPTKGGKGSFEGAMNAVRLFKKHQVEFNTLTVVNQLNAQHPKRVYQFLKGIGSRFMQFIPIQEVEALTTTEDLISPQFQGEVKPTKESVKPEDFGNFLITIFDQWVRQDVGRYFVQHFDIALSTYMGYPASLCIFSKYCGQAGAMEHSGDVFACDHYVYPEYKIGNITKDDLQKMIQSPQQRAFGVDKFQSLSEDCLNCQYLKMCFGECPKNRFAKTDQGEKIAYLCEGYFMFFEHISPYLKQMKELLDQQRPPAEIMNLIKKKRKK